VRGEVKERMKIAQGWRCCMKVFAIRHDAVKGRAMPSRPIEFRSEDVHHLATVDCCWSAVEVKRHRSISQPTE